MSDQSQGPGWWQASDGKWYAPHLHPDYKPPAPPPAGPPPTGPAFPHAMPMPTPPAASPASAPGRPAAPKTASNPGKGCLVAIAAVVVLIIIGAIAGSGNDDDSSSSGGSTGGASNDNTSQQELDLGAFDVCKQFVKDRLKAPGSASFRNFFEDDGEVSVTHTGDEYTVISSVDADNSFGAKLRNNFVCSVTHVSGENWRLVNLSMA